MYWVLVAFHLDGYSEAIRPFEYEQPCERVAQSISEQPLSDDTEGYQCLPVGGDYRLGVFRPFPWTAGLSRERGYHLTENGRARGGHHRR